MIINAISFHNDCKRMNVHYENNNMLTIFVIGSITIYRHFFKINSGLGSAAKKTLFEILSSLI